MNPSFHIGMILCTLGMSPNGFVIKLLHLKASSQLDVVHGYQLTIIHISNRCATLGAHPTTLPSNKVSLNLTSNNDFLVFHYVQAHASHEAPLGRGSPFCLASSTWLSLNTTLIQLVGRPYGPFPLHWYDIVHFGCHSPNPCLGG